MKTYTFALTRVYRVTVEAENEDEARHYAEFFLGDPKDGSTETHRKEHNFSIGEIEMLHNDAVSLPQTTPPLQA